MTRAAQENIGKPMLGGFDPTGMIGRLPKEVMTELIAKEQEEIKQKRGNGGMHGKNTVYKKQQCAIYVL